MNYSVAVFGYNRDQDFLPYCLKSIKQHLKGYQEIVLVWDDYVREREINFQELRDDTGVNFRVVNHSDIFNWPKKIGEWGWIKQQLAKMLCYSYIDNNRTYIVDADVVFTGDPELFSKNKIYLRQRVMKVPESYKHFPKKYLDITEFSEHTWVGSTCMFEHDILKEIDKMCFQKNNKNLIECVNEMIESNNHPDLPFSEFEIYGHICSKYFADRFIFTDRNWAYGNEHRRLDDPIQIEWASHDDNLDQKYKILTSRKL